MNLFLFVGMIKTFCNNGSFEVDFIELIYPLLFLPYTICHIKNERLHK